MKVFSDMHHQALFYSLQLLFEKRLQWQLFRPVGVEWYNEGFWKVYDHPATVNQYLSLDQRYTPIDKTPPLNRLKSAGDNFYEIVDPIHDVTQKAITLEQFKSQKFDIVIASMPDHIEPFKTLIRNFQPHAKLIVQAGNMFDYNWDQFNNLLASATIPNVPGKINHVIYHQEMDLVNYVPSSNNRIVRSYVNLFPQLADYPYYCQLQQNLPEYSFENYGAGCDNGSIGKKKDEIKSIQGSDFGLHFKPGGDGFGHVLHSFYMVGRAPIVKAQYYQGQLAERLFSDNNCIKIDGLNEQEVSEKIKNTDPNIGENAFKRFREVVNYDEEFEQIKMFLSKLV